MFDPDGPTFYELAVQALSSTQRGYDLLAPKFDHTPFRTPAVILDAIAAQLAPLGPFAAGLDICCGTGAGLALLRPLCREHVVGLDFSQGMLDVARRHFDARVELVCGDALALPFDAEFDLAVCFGAHGHILPKDEPRFVAEVWRVLRPGGRFVFATSYWPPVWSPNFWVARIFNGVMRVRNFVLSPPFVMYYLTFMLPEVERLLRRQGFEVGVRPLSIEGPLRAIRMVTAIKTSARH